MSPLRDLHVTCIAGDMNKECQTQGPLPFTTDAYSNTYKPQVGSKYLHYVRETFVKMMTRFNLLYLYEVSTIQQKAPLVNK